MKATGFQDPGFVEFAQHISGFPLAGLAITWVGYGCARTHVGGREEGFHSLNLDTCLFIAPIMFMIIITPRNAGDWSCCRIMSKDSIWFCLQGILFLLLGNAIILVLREMVELKLIIHLTHSLLYLHL